MQDKFNVTVQGRMVEGIFRFETNDWPCEDSETSVRLALEMYRDDLIETAKNVDQILKSDVPEKAELLMTNNPTFKINEVTLTAPDISEQAVNKGIHSYLENILKKETP